MNKPLPLLDLIEAKARRDNGMASVGRSGWMSEAVTVASMVRHRIRTPFAIEDLREAMVAQGLSEPHHPNAWGAFGMSLTKRNMIVRTGEWRNAKAKKSHACTVPLYRWVMP